MRSNRLENEESESAETVEELLRRTRLRAAQEAAQSLATTEQDEEVPELESTPVVGPSETAIPEEEEIPEDEQVTEEEEEEEALPS